MKNLVLDIVRKGYQERLLVRENFNSLLMVID